MTEQTTRHPDGATPRFTVTLCRDCCCGSTTKHPNVDHALQRRTLETLAGGDVRVRTVDCLDVCERSNVVMVRDHAAPRRQRDTWFGGLLYRAHTAALVEWVSSGAGAVPALLAPLRFVHRVPPSSRR